MTVLIINALAECTCYGCVVLLPLIPSQVSWLLEWSCCGTSQSALILHSRQIAYSSTALDGSLQSFHRPGSWGSEEFAYYLRNV